MSEFFKGITFPWQEVTAADDAIVRRTALPDRRLTGCELSHVGSTLTMTAGSMLVCGRQFRHTATQSWSLTGAASGFARLLLTIDVTKASTEDAFEQVSASIEYATAADGFPVLRQDDINGAGTIYQTAICIVSLSNAGITGLVNALISGAVTAEEVGARPNTWTPTAAEVGAVTPAEVTAAVKKAAPINLLDNSDFRNLVNQRGKTIYYGYGYSIDRWYTTGGDPSESFHVSVENGYVKLYNGSSVMHGLEQRFPYGYLDPNKVYTVAWKDTYGDGNINVQQASIGHYPEYEMSVLYFGLNPGETRPVVWIALYEGEYTAETLPVYHPKGYAHEFAECRRYYQNDVRINISQTHEDYFAASYNHNMRIVPTMTFIQVDIYGKNVLTDFTNAVADIGTMHVGYVKIPTMISNGYTNGSLLCSLSTEL